MSQLRDYFDLLGLAPDELVGMFWRCSDDDKHTLVTPCSTVEYAVSQISDNYDIYLAPNPTKGPPRKDKGRGKMEDVTRCVAIYADLDIKDGACPDMDAANGLVREIESVIGMPVAATIFSGGGIQPIWTLDDCTAEQGRKLLKRFGRLVKRIAGDRHMHADSIFDTARVLRVPGTFNHKYGDPVETALIIGSCTPMTPEELDDRLNEVGIWDLGDDDSIGAEVIAYPESSDWAIETCGYMHTVVEEWKTEEVIARHPWLLCQFVRLECARRGMEATGSCFTEADYRRADAVLVNRFQCECARPGDTRTIKRLEVSDIRDEARARASRKTDAQIAKELGDHGHLLKKQTEMMSSLPKVNSPVQESIPETFPGLLDAEDHFWDKRDVLKEIYDYSMSRMRSPWAVLGACAAMALDYARPHTKLEDIGVGLGSLNSFIAIVAGSGQGKSTSIRIANELMPVHPHFISVGSGEGLLDAFVMRDEEKKIGVRESVLVKIDEVDLLQAMTKGRPGSSLLGLLKSAFTADEIALQYANKKYPVLKQDSYGLTVLCAIQPGKAGWIFEDVKGGFPQRFMWFPAVDARISRKNRREAYTFGLTLPSTEDFRYPREVAYPLEAKDYIDACFEAGSQGKEDAGLDVHAAFARAKFAYALTILDGRVLMNLDDWKLSGAAANVSALTRDWVQRGIRSERERDATERGEYAGTMRAVSDETKNVYSAQRAERVMGKVAAKIQEAGTLADRDLRNAFQHKDRAYVTAATAKLAEDHVIKPEPGPKGGVAWIYL